MKKTVKSFLILIIIFTFLGCKERQENKTFDSIDYSFYAGYFKSIKVFENGKTYLCYDNNSHFDENLPERKEFYSLTLDKIQLDSISKMVKTLFSIKIDTIYELNSDSKVSFSFVIKSKKNILQTSYSGGLYPEERLNPLYDLVNYLNDLSDKIKYSSDSTFIFESRKILILPPPPPAMKKK